MDWYYVRQAVQASEWWWMLPLLPLPVLAWGAKPGRWRVALAPGVAVVGAFVGTCLVAGLDPARSVWIGLVHVAINLAAIALMVPSLQALERPWAGLSHLFTLAGAALLWLAGGVVLLRDSL